MLWKENAQSYEKQAVKQTRGGVYIAESRKRTKLLEYWESEGQSYEA